jgi:hypothetical protein
MCKCDECKAHKRWVDSLSGDAWADVHLAGADISDHDFNRIFYTSFYAPMAIFVLLSMAFLFF